MAHANCKKQDHSADQKAGTNAADARTAVAKGHEDETPYSGIIEQAPKEEGDQRGDDEQKRNAVARLAGDGPRARQPWLLNPSKTLNFSPQYYKHYIELIRGKALKESQGSNTQICRHCVPNSIPVILLRSRSIISSYFRPRYFRIIRSVPQVLLYPQTVPELPLKAPFNSQNSYLYLHLPLHLPLHLYLHPYLYPLSPISIPFKLWDRRPPSSRIARPP